MRTELSLPAVARRCAGDRAVAIEAASELGGGVLVLLRYGDSLVSGFYPVVVAGDTSAPRGAEVAVRYMRRDAALGFALDSGTVHVTAAGPVITGSVRGRGLDQSVRTGFEAMLTGVPLSADTVSCRLVR